MTVVGTPQRPVLLIALGLVAYLCAVVGLTTSFSAGRSLLDSHDSFVAAERSEAPRVLGLLKDVGTSDERERIAQIGAEALWARRGVLLPLSAMNAIASLLVMFGVAGVLAPMSRRAAWGRSAWQLGLWLWLPVVGLQMIVGELKTRELLAAITSLHDPVAEYVRTTQVPRGPEVITQLVVSGLYLLGTGLYLGTQRVRRYCEAKDGLTS